MLCEMTVKVLNIKYVVQYRILTMSAKKECVVCESTKKVVWHEIILEHVFRMPSAHTDVPANILSLIKEEIGSIEGCFEQPRCRYHTEMWQKCAAN